MHRLFIAWMFHWSFSCTVLVFLQLHLGGYMQLHSSFPNSTGSLRIVGSAHGNRNGRFPAYRRDARSTHLIRRLLMAPRISLRPTRRWYGLSVSSFSRETNYCRFGDEMISNTTLDGQAEYSPPGRLRMPGFFLVQSFWGSSRSSSPFDFAGLDVSGGLPASSAHQNRKSV